ncbi:MAG: hypothetical protein ACYTXA_03150 [Nostoc sp.]
MNNISASLVNEDSFKDFEPCEIISRETKKTKQKKSLEINLKGKTSVCSENSPEIGVFIE